MHVKIAYELFVVRDARKQIIKKLIGMLSLRNIIHSESYKHLHTNESFLILRIYGL